MAFPAGELAALYHERGENEGSFRQVKTFQRGPQEILRSADPELMRQEIWAQLTVLAEPSGLHTGLSAH